MKISKKFAVVAVPAVMALSAANTADSKILLMSQEGWEVSFDGAANAFFMKNSATDAPSLSGGAAFTPSTYAGVISANDDASIVTGLLPNVWGMTLKAPTANGLDISARLGLYTHMNGGENALGNGEINLRETSGSVSGSFGTILIGRSLGIHQSNAILNDMLLFGVGAAASDGNLNTTLGRIGLGYLYTDFQPQISWTLPSMGGLGAKIGVFDPMDVAADTVTYSATDASAPRVEAQITYNTEVSGIGANFWVDGAYQVTGRTSAQAQAVSVAAASAGFGTDDTDVTSASVGFGTKLSFEGLSVVASGFFGQGVGMRGRYSVGPVTGRGGSDSPTSTGALDDFGKERNTYGGYAQATYDFGQGTNAGYSFGGNYLVKTGNDMNNLGTMNYQQMHSGMIWHNVTDNFRVIVEGGYTEKTWYLADTDQEDSFGGVGAFFIW